VSSLPSVLVKLLTLLSSSVNWADIWLVYSEGYFLPGPKYSVVLLWAVFLEEPGGFYDKFKLSSSSGF
jgi:hypothetical protein